MFGGGVQLDFPIGWTNDLGLTLCCLFSSIFVLTSIAAASNSSGQTQKKPLVGGLPFKINQGCCFSPVPGFRPQRDDSFVGSQPYGSGFQVLSDSSWISTGGLGLIFRL